MDAITSSPCLVESQSFIYIPCPTDAKPGNGKYQVYVFITLAYSGNLGYFGGGGRWETDVVFMWSAW